MLYPLWISLWAKINGLLGIHAPDALAFLRISQAMNAFAAAASVGFLYLLIEPLAGVMAAALGSVAFGFSRTLILQATTSDEPLAGLFFALLALVILLAGIRRSSPILIFSSGFCMTLGLASYEAMGTVIAPAFLLCCFWPLLSSEQTGLAPFVRRLAAAAAGGAAGVLTIYGWAYASQGVRFTEMPSRFLQLGGAPEVYTGVDLLPNKVLNAPFGLIGWLLGALPPDYAGVRSLLHHPHRLIWVPAAVAAFALVTVIFVLVLRHWRAVAGPATPLRLSLVLLCGLLLGFPVWYWGPLNPKLWLLPLACLVFAVFVAWGQAPRASRGRRMLTACLLVCLSAEVIRNVPPVVAGHLAPTPYWEDARRLAGMVGPEDWVLLDFDDLSVLWLSVWGYNANTLTLPASTTQSARQWLDQAQASCRQSRGRILIVGLLRYRKSEWDAFLGARVRLPFELLDEYRKQSTLLMRAHQGPDPIEVWQFTPARL